jgi:hypothetical protein
MSHLPPFGLLRVKNHEGTHRVPGVGKGIRAAVMAGRGADARPVWEMRSIIGFNSRNSRARTAD